MRRFTILTCFLTAVLMLSSPQDVSAKKKSRKQIEAQAPAPAKKTGYEKFISRKGLQTVPGFITVHKDGGDVWFEIPDSLIGRRVIQRSIIEKSSCIEFGVGKDISNNPIYRIEKTDSLILFQVPALKFYVEEDEDNIKTALSASNAGQTIHALPIKYRNADSTAYVVKANDLFDFKRKEVADLVGYGYSGLAVIAKADVNDKLSRIMSVDNFCSTIGVRKETSFTLTLSMMGFEVLRKPVFSAEIISSFTLVPEKEVVIRDVDDRVGTRKVGYKIYSQDGAIRDRQAACRWDLSGREYLTFYVDTLLGPSWSEAVKRGLEAWNPAFERIGYKNLIKVLPYPADDPSFRVDNPYQNVVTYVQGAGRSLTANILTDKSTGEIMGVRIMVPGNLVGGIRWTNAFDACDVDPRFQGYHIADDAICDVLAARVMSLMGCCLGLERNHAGSHAWSPQQLSDVEFTQANGITASVTDDVIFNTFARPGDKERGLVTIVDRVGPYDEYAIEWLYSHDESKEMRDSLIESHAGDPVYFFAYRQRGTVSDPRVIDNMLGNDPIAYAKAALSHYHFVAENAAEWLMDDSVPQEYSDLFIDWLHTAAFDVASRLSKYIGGMYANQVREGSGDRKFTPVPENLQKECMKVMFDIFTDVEWLDKERELRLLPGPNKEPSHFGRFYLISYASIWSRLLQVALSVHEAGSTYTVEEYLDDIEGYLFKDISKGRLNPGSEMVVAGYAATFMKMCPNMKQNYDDYKAGGLNHLAGETEFRVSVSGVPAAYVEEFELYAWNRMQKLERMLMKAKAACSNSHDKRKYEYLISITSAALGK